MAIELNQIALAIHHFVDQAANSRAQIAEAHNERDENIEVNGQAISGFQKTDHIAVGAEH